MLGCLSHSHCCGNPNKLCLPGRPAALLFVFGPWLPSLSGENTIFLSQAEGYLTWWLITVTSELGQLRPESKCLGQLGLNMKFLSQGGHRFPAWACLYLGPFGRARGR